MKGIILYESKNGATKEYAEWLAQDTGFTCVPAKKAGRLDEYDIVVIGSCVRAWKVDLGPWIKAKWPRLQGKKLAIFTVAGATVDSPKRAEWLAASVGDGIASAVPHFALRGRMVAAKMRWIDRKLIGLGKKMLAKKNPEEAAKMGQDFDYVDRATLKPLADFVKKLGA